MQVFLCLCQVACEPNSDTDSILQGTVVDPDKFVLKIGCRDKGTNNYVEIGITPGSSGMLLEEFFITACLDNNDGAVYGSQGKKSNHFVYDIDMHDRCLKEAYLKLPSACLGEYNTSFIQGKKVLLRLRPSFNTKANSGGPYTLTVKVERKGTSPHTETKIIKLTAKKVVANTKEKTNKGGTSNTSSKIIETPLGTMLDDTESPINLSAPSVYMPIPTEEVSTINTYPQMLVSDTGLPATQNEISNAESEQHHSPPDVAAASTNNTDTSAATPASN